MDSEISGAYIKEIRLRLGWCSAEMARRLSITTEEMIEIEQSSKQVPSQLKDLCANLLRYADDYCNKISQDPFAEKVMSVKRLSQVTGTALFHLNEKDFID